MRPIVTSSRAGKPPGDPLLDLGNQRPDPTTLQRLLRAGNSFAYTARSSESFEETLFHFVRGDLRRPLVDERNLPFLAEHFTRLPTSREPMGEAGIPFSRLWWFDLRAKTIFLVEYELTCEILKVEPFSKVSYDDDREFEALALVNTHQPHRIRIACPPPGARTICKRDTDVTGCFEIVTGSGLVSQFAPGPSA